MDAYVRLKILGMDWLSNDIENWLIDDPKLADIALSATTLVTAPIFGCLADITNYTLKRIKYFGLDTFPLSKSTQAPRFPIEIGRFLMEKVTINPSDYLGCLDVIQHYKQNELYKVLQSLDTGIKEQSMDSVVKDLNELNMIMDNIWQTAGRITRAGKVIGSGIRIALGLAGIGVSSTVLPLAGASAMGFLAQLGVNVADKFVEGNNLGERAARMLNKKYIVTVYDFTKKHSIRLS